MENGLMENGQMENGLMENEECGGEEWEDSKKLEIWTSMKKIYFQ